MPTFFMSGYRHWRHFDKWRGSGGSQGGKDQGRGGSSPSRRAASEKGQRAGSSFFTSASRGLFGCREGAGGWAGRHRPCPSFPPSPVGAAGQGRWGGARGWGRRRGAEPRGPGQPAHCAVAAAAAAPRLLGLRFLSRARLGRHVLHGRVDGLGVAPAALWL